MFKDAFCLLLLYALERSVCKWRRALLEKTAGNRKGCDFGYALADDSCEGVLGVEACTVAAFKRSPLSRFQTSAEISQSRRFFRVWRRRRVASLRRPPGLLQAASYYRCRSFGPSTLWLRPWLCSNRRLLRESCRRGRMYRRNLCSDACFRSSKPRRRSRNPVDFFGSGGAGESPRCTDRSVYFKPAPYLSPFFSTVNESHPNLGLGNVNAQGRCKQNII